MIVTVTVNPAMDRVLVLESFRLNVTNRIARQFGCVGGKGTHISVNLSLLGVRSTALGVVRGPVGGEIVSALRGHDIDVRFLHLDEGNSRTNYVLVDPDGNCTLVAERGRPLPEQALDRLLESYAAVVEKGDAVVLSGDASNLRGGSLQETMMDLARERGARVFLDTSGEALARGVARRPFLVKPNADELAALTGSPADTEEQVLAALDRLEEAGAAHVVVSRGAAGSLAGAEGRRFRVLAPAVEARNTVGCGDALLAGLLAGFERGLAIEENLRLATAAAAAAAREESTVGFDAGLLPELARRVRVEELPRRRSL